MVARRSQVVRRPVWQQRVEGSPDRANASHAPCIRSASACRPGRSPVNSSTPGLAITSQTNGMSRAWVALQPAAERRECSSRTGTSRPGCQRPPGPRPAGWPGSGTPGRSSSPPAARSAARPSTPSWRRYPAASRSNAPTAPTRAEPRRQQRVEVEPVPRPGRRPGTTSSRRGWTRPCTADAGGRAGGDGLGRRRAAGRPRLPPAGRPCSRRLRAAGRPPSGRRAAWRPGRRPAGRAGRTHTEVGRGPTSVTRSACSRLRWAEVDPLWRMAAPNSPDAAGMARRVPMLMAPGRFPEDGDASRVAAERLDVVPDPLQGRDLIEDAAVARTWRTARRPASARWRKPSRPSR